MNYVPDGNKLDIKLVAENQLSLVGDLYAEMYDGLGESRPPKERVIEVRRQAIAGERIFWLATSSEKIIGFVDFKVMSHQANSKDLFGVIFDLFIREQNQRQGYGRVLAEKALHLMIEQGANPIELNVLPHNTKALAFWKNIGFELHLYSLKLSR